MRFGQTSDPYELVSWVNEFGQLDLANLTQSPIADPPAKGGRVGNGSR
jgi:hypothetical protein